MALSDEDRSRVAELVQDEVRRIVRDGIAPADGAHAPPDAGPGVAAARRASSTRPPTSEDAPAGRVAHALGFPPHALLATVPIGAFACGVAFDVFSHVAPEPYTYPRSAYWLIVVGLVTALIAGLSGVLDHRRLAPGSVGRSMSMTHLVVTDVAVLLFLASWAARRRTTFTTEVPLGIIGLSVVALAVLVVGSAIGARLAHSPDMSRAGGVDDDAPTQGDEGSAVASAPTALESSSRS
jgi:uncharacterized membrane protein